jgi:hypothetical protein
VTAVRRRGGSSPTAAPSTIIAAPQQGTHEQSTGSRVTFAVGYEPSGARRRWLLVVLVCNACEGTHHHYADSPHGGIRRRGCGTGFYDLRAHPVLGAHPSPGAA